MPRTEHQSLQRSKLMSTRAGITSKIICIRCSKVKNKSNFSNSKLQELRNKTKDRRNVNFEAQPFIACRNCIGGAKSEVKCGSCEKYKALDSFARNQRSKGDEEAVSLDMLDNFCLSIDHQNRSASLVSLNGSVIPRLQLPTRRRTKTMQTRSNMMTSVTSQIQVPLLRAGSDSIKAWVACQYVEMAQARQLLAASLCPTKVPTPARLPNISQLSNYREVEACLVGPHRS